MRNKTQRWLIIFGLAASAPVFTSCTQVGSLTPVAGDAIAEVSFATNDVLIQQDIDIKIAPICEGVKPDFVCTGETMKSETIQSKTWGDDAENLSVVVAGRQIFTGKVKEIITKAGRKS